MCGGCGQTTQQTSSSSGPPPQVMGEYQGLVNRATNVANQPYQPYQGEMVAPLSSQTLAGLGGINQYANAAQPWLQQAGEMTKANSGPVNPEQFQGMGSLQNFMNPYTQSVIQATQGEMNNQNQQQAQFLNSANMSSGAFGGDRAGIGQSILANQQQLAEAPTIAGLNQANFTQAMQNWQNQQGVNLGAQQANATRGLTGAAQLGQIGVTGQQEGMQGAQGQIQAGMIPQSEQQQIDTAAQNMYQQGQAYPFTTTGWLGNIIEGTGSLSGGQSQTTSPGPNSITGALGMGTQALGMLGSLITSDVRLKENVEHIGKTFDGQNIYRYNFKGDPRTQIGLLAQEEAYRHPGAVQRIGMGDMLGIDYEGATDDAAERGHFQSGGMPEAPPGGLTQGVMLPGRSGAMSAGALSPDYALMAMGDPGARMGLGSMALLGGTTMRPHPDLPLASSRFAGAGQAPPSGGGTPIGQGLPSFTRQGFQGGGAPVAAGPNGQFGYYTPGFQPGIDPVNPVAGVSEALFGQESAGSKHPYTGIDADQIAAIGGGEWLPPITGAKMPDFQNLGSSPQFGSAEASLKGLFGSDYTPGSVPPGTAAPAAPPSTPATPPPAADAGNYGLRPGFIAANPGKTPAQLATMVDAYHNPSGGFTPAQANQLLNLASQGLVRGGGGGGGGGVTGNSGGGTGNMARGGRTGVPPAIAVQRHLQGRSGFQGGGTPSEDGPERVGNIVPLAAANMPWPRQIDSTGQWGPKTVPPAHVRVAPEGGYRRPAPHIDPRATALAPAPGGGGGARSPFTQVSLMGGRPISALDLSGMFGHYTPTTGNARGATYIPPTATAQAPEHPAITAMRHIARAHAALRQAVPNHPPLPPPRPVPSAVGAYPESTSFPTGLPQGPGPVGDYPESTNFPTGLPQGPGPVGDYPESTNFPTGLPQGPGPVGAYPESTNFPTGLPQGPGPVGDYPESTSFPTGLPPLARLPHLGGASGSYQGGGGVMGSSPVQNSAFSTSRDSGFGDLFGGGERPGFAEGGDPFLEEIRVSAPGSQRGPGPPPPPQAPQQQSSSGGDQSKDTKDGLGKLGSAVKGLLNPSSSATPSTVGPSPGNVGSWNTGAIAGPDISDISVAGVNAPLDLADVGFAIGGGVGLGSLRRPFQDGGEAAPTAIDKFLTTDAQPVAAPAGGGAPAADVQDLINQNFGERAGYATHISSAESGLGKSYVGDGGSSFGPFQLHYGGVNKDMPHPGLGDQFTQETGLDARDPKTVPDQIKFVANYTAKHGWNDWTTAHEGGANVASAEAQPVSATTSYGGGFALPGTGSNVGQLDRNNLQAPTMGDELRHDPFGYMMTVGAGMAASRSPWLTVGIGEGLVAGNKFLEQGRQLEKEWGTAQAQINNLGAEAREHDADAGLKTVQLQIAQRMAQIQIQAMREAGFDIGGGTSGTGAGGQGGGGGGLGGIGTLGPIGSKPGAGAAPAGGAAPGATGADGQPISDYTQDPTFLQGQALIRRGTILGAVPAMAEVAKGFIAQGQTLEEAAKAAWEKRVAPTVAGQTKGAEEAATPHIVYDAQGHSRLVTGTEAIGSRDTSPVMSPEAEAAKEAGVKGAGKTAEEAATPHVVYDADGNAFPVSGDKYLEIARANSAGQPALVNGRPVTTEISPEAAVRKAAQTKTIEAQTEAQKPVLQEYLTNREKFESTYDQTRSEISELSNIYQHAQAGRSSEAQAELASWANAFGFKLPQAASFDAGMKSAIQQAFAAVANSGLQKAPRAGLREATMMVASPTRDPAALRKILTDQLATLDYQHDMYQNIPGHNLNVGDDMDSFTSKHKYVDYLGKARKEIPIFKGITPETLKNVTGEDWPAPPTPRGVPPNAAYSPSRKQWRDPSGKLYDESGKPL